LVLAILLRYSQLLLLKSHSSSIFDQVTSSSGLNHSAISFSLF
jgi:hypothetical protein